MNDFADSFPSVLEKTKAFGNVESIQKAEVIGIIEDKPSLCSHKLFHANVLKYIEFGNKDIFLLPVSSNTSKIILDLMSPIEINMNCLEGWDLPNITAFTDEFKKFKMPIDLAIEEIRKKQDRNWSAGIAHLIAIEKLKKDYPELNAQMVMNTLVFGTQEDMEKLFKKLKKIGKEWVTKKIHEFNEKIFLYRQQNLFKTIEKYRANSLKDRKIVFLYRGLFSELKNNKLSDNEIKELQNVLSKFPFILLNPDDLIDHDSTNANKKHCMKYAMHFYS